MKEIILYIDPLNATTHYNYCLMNILYKSSVKILFLTTVFPWDKELPNAPGSVSFFFRVSNFISFRLGLPQKYRRILRALEYPFDLLRLFFLIRTHHVRLVHFNWSRLPFFDQLFFKILNRAGVRILYTAHNYLPHNTGSNYKKLFYSIYTSVHHITCLTNYVRSQICEGMKISPERISIIPHTNYSAIIRLKKKDDSQSRGKAQINLLFFGLIEPYKGLDILLIAFSKIQYTFPHLHLYICGNPYEDFAKYEKIILEYQIDRSRLHLELRYLNIYESIEVIQKSDLVVLPYKESSQSGVIPFVNTLGKPVIATRVGGLPEMILEGQNGYLVEPNNPEELAKRIAFVISSDEQLKILQESTASVAEKLFSSDVIRNEFIKLYTKLQK